MNSCISCNCGNEIGKYYDMFKKAHSEGKVEEFFDKIGLLVCCRTNLVSCVEFPNYINRGIRK